MVKLNEIHTEEELQIEMRVRFLDLMKRHGKETDKDRGDFILLHNELTQLESSASDVRNRLNHTKKILDLDKRILKLIKERDEISGKTR